MKKINVLIPAAGKGSRSGLSIPKSLQEINGIPIIIKICNQLNKYDNNPKIVINKNDEALFLAAFKKYKINAKLIYQNTPLGMGDAILQAKDYIKDGEEILLVWSDIPFLQKSTIDGLVLHHFKAQNIFSLASYVCSNPYTLVERINGKVVKLLETHKNIFLDKVTKGERDIGLFIFDKKIVFDLLEKDFEEFDTTSKVEFGFLSIIEKISANKWNIDAYAIATEKDILSFNTPEDLIKILAMIDQ